MEQWNQIEDPKADSHIKRYLIDGKDSTADKQEDCGLFTKCAGSARYPYGA